MREQKMTERLMTTEQARLIQKAAEEVCQPVDEFVQVSLEDAGNPASTLFLYQKLVRQLDWLLAGGTLDRAPYLDVHRRLGGFPFRKPLGSDQIDMPIEHYVKEYVLPILEDEA